MPLPAIQHPTYEVYLKSLDRKVKYRPFLVKEEKLMLMSKESEDNDSVIAAIKQVIQNCCLEEIDVETLPIFDIQMFFVHLRMKSIGENVDLTFQCNKQIPGTEDVCTLINEYSLNLEKVQYDLHPDHTSEIKLTDEIGVKFKYPLLTDVGDLAKKFSDPLQISLKLISENIVYLYDKDQVYDRTQFTEEELQEFLSNLSQGHLDKLLMFFATVPKVVLRDKVNCKKCGQEHEVYAENISHFFI